MNVCVVNGCRSRICTSKSSRFAALGFDIERSSSSLSRSMSPQELGRLELGSWGRRSRGEQTNMVVIGREGFLLGARW